MSIIDEWSTQEEIPYDEAHVACNEEVLYVEARLILTVPRRKFLFPIMRPILIVLRRKFYDEALADSTLDEVCVKEVFCNWKEVALMTKFFLVEAFIQVLDLKLDKLCFMFKFQDIL